MKIFGFYITRDSHKHTFTKWMETNRLINDYGWRIILQERHCTDPDCQFKEYKSHIFFE